MKKLIIAVASLVMFAAHALAGDYWNVNKTSGTAAVPFTFTKGVTFSSSTVFLNSATIPNLSGGAAGQLPYQSGANTTVFVSTGTAGYILTSGGVASPIWTSTASIHVATATYSNTAGSALTASTATWVVNGGSLTGGDVNGMRITGAMATPVTGAGLELYYAGGVSTLLSIDRGAGAAKPIYFEGDKYIFGNSLGGQVGIGAGLTSPNNLIQVLDLINFDNGRYSTSLGYKAGYGNTASYNTFVGYQAGATSPTGQNNTAVGFQAGYSLTTGARNVLFGYHAGDLITTGGWNNFFGDQAGTATTGGSYNIGIGHAALFSNTVGYYNVGIGQGALYGNTTAYDNIAIGYHTAYGGTTGTRNISVGTHAAFYNSTGNDNTIVGHKAASDATAMGGGNFSGNTILGSNAGYSITTGSDNTIFGFNAGDTLTTGSRNIIIGKDSDVSTGAQNDYLAIGSIINGNLATGTVNFPHQPSAKAHLSADATIATGTTTKITWNVEDQDTQSEYDPTTNHRYTATAAGDYLASAACYAYSSPTADAQYVIHLYVDGVSFRSSASIPSVSGVGFNMNITDIIPLTAGQYVEVFVTNPAVGGSIKCYSSGGFSHFAIKKLP